MWGRLFAGPIAVVYWGLGLWGFILISQYIYSKLGWIGVLISIVIFPAAYTLTPLWAGFADGYWLPALVSYSPIALMFVVSLVASALEARS